MKIVIIGGGIIGCATAYYLKKIDAEAEVTVVERHEVAGHASGKAGGFLALNWCDGGRLEPLARKSFPMHEDLAKELGTEIGFRKLDTLSMGIEPEGERMRSGNERVPKWVDGTVRKMGSMGTTSTTAQVHPELLTKALLEKAKDKGCKLVKGKAVGIDMDGKKVKSVKLEAEQSIECDVVLVAMGPWSNECRRWFPEASLCRIAGNRAHSIVLDTSKHNITADALFLEIGVKDPEIYPRPDGTIYMCGNGDTAPLPDDPADCLPDLGATESLKTLAGKVSSALADSPTLKEQACYLPTSADGIPLIGKIPKYEGGYIATAHSCWGILNGPATGLAMAELILKGRATSVDISNFDPGRF